MKNEPNYLLLARKALTRKNKLLESEKTNKEIPIK
jgi:ribosomal protein L39E